MPTALDATARQPECHGNSRAAWIVASTHPQAERWAQSNLNRVGYQTYLPLYAARVRDRVTRSMTHIVERPLFPGYLFAWWNEREGWSQIKAAPGVKSLVGTNGRPDMVRAGTVEALQAGDNARRIPLPPGALWAAGDACTPAHGPFLGLPAAVVAVEGQIATIAVMMLGALRRVQIPVEHLSRRDED